MNVQVQQQPPQDGEQQALESVAQDASLETPSEETRDALGADDNCCRLGYGDCQLQFDSTRSGKLTIRDFSIIDLPIRLDDPEGIGDGVRQHRRHKSDKGKAEQPQQNLILRHLGDSMIAI